MQITNVFCFMHLLDYNPVEAYSQLSLGTPLLLHRVEVHRVFIFFCSNFISTHCAKVTCFVVIRTAVFCFTAVTDNACGIEKNSTASEAVA